MKPAYRVLVTCGPTREPLDPVRFISNRSTGLLGIELARAFASRGHQVVLAAGPIDLPADLGPRVAVKRFETARELHRLAVRAFGACDAVCMTAAVADFRPAAPSSSKLKRGASTLTVKLLPNPDILADLGRRRKPGQVLVGFAVETSRLEARAAEKLRRKRLDLVVAQTVGGRKNPFGPVRMDTVLLDRTGARWRLRGVSKKALARRIAGQTQTLIDRARAI